MRKIRERWNHHQLNQTPRMSRWHFWRIQRTQNILKSLRILCRAHYFCCILDWVPSTARSSRSQIFFKIDVKNFASFTKKHPCCSLFFIKLQPFRSEDTPTQALSREICKIFKSTFFLQNTFDFDYCFCTA